LLLAPAGRELRARSLCCRRTCSLRTTICRTTDTQTPPRGPLSSLRRETGAPQQWVTRRVFGTGGRQARLLPDQYRGGRAKGVELYYAPRRIPLLGELHLVLGGPLIRRTVGSVGSKQADCQRVKRRANCCAGWLPPVNGGHRAICDSDSHIRRPFCDGCIGVWRGANHSRDGTRGSASSECEIAGICAEPCSSDRPAESCAASGRPVPPTSSRNDRESRSTCESRGSPNSWLYADDSLRGWLRDSWPGHTCH
jgi:hypothetical protein